MRRTLIVRPEAGLFRALRDEAPIPVVTPFNLYLLWTRTLIVRPSGH